MKFTFQTTNEDGVVITHEFAAETWYEALDHFVKFLRGAGYQLKDNSVGINEAAGHLFLKGFCFSNITTFEQE
jgi:hypothetical protein